MLIPGVYIKGNDLAGILNGKIKALLETSMINWSALLVLYHDKVKLTSPGHLPGNSSIAPSSEDPLPPSPWKTVLGERPDLQPGAHPHTLSCHSVSCRWATFGDPVDTADRHSSTRCQVQNPSGMTGRRRLRTCVLPPCWPVWIPAPLFNSHAILAEFYNIFMPPFFHL